MNSDQFNLWRIVWKQTNLEELISVSAAIELIQAGDEKYSKPAAVSP